MGNTWRMARTIAGAVLLAGSAASAQAAFVDAPVPASAYISKGGLDWAWANPVPGADLSFQGGQGWRLPTLAELQNAPLATEFLKAGGNVPFNGSDPVSGANFSAQNSAYTNAASAGACATPYFSAQYHHCDWQDGLGQPLGPWEGLPGAPSFADQLVVRSLSPTPTINLGDPAQIPALGAEGLALLSLGLAIAGLVAARRRKSG